MKKYILFFIGLGLIWFSCESKKEQFILDSQDILPLQFKALPDTLLPPEIVEINQENSPIQVEIKPKAFPLKFPFGIGKPMVKSYGPEDGLPSELITDLEMDKNGKLWIAGLGFLGNFDGTTFSNIQSFDQSGSFFVYDLFFDSKGTLWIISTSGVYTLTGEIFSKFSIEEEGELYAYSIIETKTGSIWISTSQGVFEINDQIITNHGHPSEYFGRLLYTPDERIIYSSDGNFYLKNQQLTPILGIPDRAEIHFVGKNGEIWYSYSENGKRFVAKKDGDHSQKFGENEGIPPSEFIREIAEDRSGKIWIIGNTNIYQVFDSELQVIPNSELGLVFPGKFVEDEFGNIWMGSNSGLNKISFNYQNFLESPLKGNGSENLLTDMKIDSKGNRWAFASPDKLIKYQENEALVWELEPIVGKSFASNGFVDQKDTIWMYVGGPIDQRKLIQFDGNLFKVYHNIPELLHLNHITEINLCPDGSLAFSGSGGVTFYNGKTFSHYGSKQGFPERVTNYLLDKQGSHWMGTDNHGVFVIKTDSILQISMKEGLGSVYVNDIKEDTFGNIWIANDGGLAKFDGNTLNNYGIADGLGNMVGVIKIDTRDSLMWVGSSIGISKAQIKDLNSPKIEFTTYSKMNGFELVPNLVTTSSVIEIDSMGLWSQELAKGIVRFDPKKFENKPPPVLEIKDIRINNSQVLWSLILLNDEAEIDKERLKIESYSKFNKELDAQEIKTQLDEFGNIQFDSLSDSGFIPNWLTVPYSNNTLRFEFSAISPSFGKYTKFRYFLEGYDYRWSPFSNVRETNFTNIPEGTYTLLVEAMTPYGTISKSSYSFEVLPPWYRTWWAYLIYFFLLVGLTRWIYKTQKRRLIAREREKAREKELAQAKEIEKAYSELKSTQAQLIQSEKMASLGELTAGIAHEIQNPLNFVNNFSEVSNELLDEMKEELGRGDIEEAKALAEDLQENLSKINHHGKRAGSIVKGMLEHSRKSDGEKELTDINKMADESLRLSFHGLRAKDKEFQSSFKLDLDPDLPEIEVVPQDIGRVLLNLINNAFYVVNEKAKTASEGYQPKVIVSTKKTDSGIEISVVDNGSGIPESIQEKIFQPFFTTKPTGQGTGLGLSLSYDIVKAHGGRIEVKSEPNQGTEFIIYFPL